MTTTIDPRTAGFYAQAAATYGDAYGDGCNGDENPYPANQKRWEIVRYRLKELGAKTVLEAGCGEGTPLSIVRDELGLDIVWGFDASPEMVQEAARKHRDALVWEGNICDPAAFAPRVEKYDAVLALGPFPHLTDDQQVRALRNCADATKQGGRVFVELRNEWFAWFTLNRYSAELFDSLMPRGTPRAVRNSVYTHLNREQPRLATDDTGNYASTFSRFNAPGDVPALFAAAGLKVETLHGYHVHAWPPMYEHLDPKGFRRESLALEWPHKDYASWRNLFRCSAFVVEAMKG